MVSWYFLPSCTLYCTGSRVFTHLPCCMYEKGIVRSGELKVEDTKRLRCGTSEMGTAFARTLTNRLVKVGLPRKPSDYRAKIIKKRDPVRFSFSALPSRRLHYIYTKRVLPFCASRPLLVFLSRFFSPYFLFLVAWFSPRKYLQRCPSHTCHLAPQHPVYICVCVSVVFLFLLSNKNLFKILCLI